MNRRCALLRRCGIGAVVAVVAVLTAVAADPAAASPPADPNAQGFIGFCDRNNHSVTGGRINDTPFVWKAVASQRPPASVVGSGQNAVLNIYQPRPGVDPSQWSGDQLTGASFYQQADAPAVQATNKDIPLSVVVTEFPPLVDGLYQLRIYYGKAGAALYSATYPATTIRVSGDRWSVVSGGTVNCAAATAQSLEVLSGAVTAKQAYGSPLPAAHGTPSASPLAARGTPSSAPARPQERSATAGTAGTDAPSRAADPARAAQGSLAPWLWALLPVALIAAGVAWWRRRSLTD